MPYEQQLQRLDGFALDRSRPTSVVSTPAVSMRTGSQWTETTSVREVKVVNVHVVLDVTQFIHVPQSHTEVQSAWGYDQVK